MDLASIFQAGIQECGGALFPAYCIQATKSAGVHSFLPKVRAANSIENSYLLMLSLMVNTSDSIITAIFVA